MSLTLAFILGQCWHHSFLERLVSGNWIVLRLCGKCVAPSLAFWVGKRVRAAYHVVWMCLYSSALDKEVEAIFRQHGSERHSWGEMCDTSGMFCLEMISCPFVRGKGTWNHLISLSLDPGHPQLCFVPVAMFCLIFKPLRPLVPSVSPPWCVLQKQALWDVCCESLSWTCVLGRNVYQQLARVQLRASGDVCGWSVAHGGFLLFVLRLL